MDALIGVGSLKWSRTAVVPRGLREHERALRAELGPDFIARLFPGEGSAHGAERPGQDRVPESGLLRRLARAVASAF